MTSRLEHLKKLGILMMSGVMLSSIAPFNALNASAKRRPHHSHKRVHRVIRRRRKRNRKRATRRARVRTRVIVKTKVVYRNNSNRLNRVQDKLNWLHSKLHVSPKVSNASLINRLKHSNGALAQRLHMSDGQLNHYKRSLITTNRVYYQVKNALRREQHELNSLRADIPKVVNNAVNRAKYNDRITLNTITAKERAGLKRMHVEDINIISRLVNQDNQAQKRINTLEHQQQKHYTPAKIPAAKVADNVIKHNVQRLNQVVKKQPTPIAKMTVRQLETTPITRSEKIYARINKQANDHPYLNSKYIERMMKQANIIKQGVSAHNRDVDRDFANKFDNIQAFNQIRGGKYLARKARRLAARYKKELTTGIIMRKTNLADKYLDTLLEAKANPNNSLDQERFKHMSFKDAYDHATKAQKAQMMKLHKYILKNKKYFQRGKEEISKRKFFKSHHISAANILNRNGKYLKFKGIMKQFERLRAKKQTKAVIRKEKELYIQTKSERFDEMKLIDSKIDQWSNKEASLQEQLKLVHDDWEDATGNVPMRNKLHGRERDLQNQIQFAQQQIGQLENMAQNVSTEMDIDSKNAHEEAYHNLIFGNIHDSQRTNEHPGYVRISTPTYYFNNLDITDKNDKKASIGVNEPDNAPVHQVLSADNVNLNDGTHYTMYRIKSNDDTLDDSYYVLAQYTTPASKPKINLHLRYQRARHHRTVMITQDTPVIHSMNAHAKFHGHLAYGTHVKLMGKVYNGHDMIAYKVSHKGKEVYVPKAALK